MAHHSARHKEGSPFVKIVIPVIAGLLVLSGVLYYVFSISLSDQEQLEIIVNELVDDAEHKNMRGIYDRMAEDYSDSMYKDRSAINQHMKGWALRQLGDKVELDFKDLKIEVAFADEISPDGTTATADFIVTGNDPIEEVKKYYHSRGHIKLHFVKRNGEWLLKRLEPLD